MTLLCDLPDVGTLLDHYGNYWRAAFALSSSRPFNVPKRYLQARAYANLKVTPCLETTWFRHRSGNEITREIPTCRSRSIGESVALSTTPAGEFAASRCLLQELRKQRLLR